MRRATAVLLWVLTLSVLNIATDWWWLNLVTFVWWCAVVWAGLGVIFEWCEKRDRQHGRLGRNR
jgi:hypothetical protein